MIYLKRASDNGKTRQIYLPTDSRYGIGYGDTLACGILLKNGIVVSPTSLEFDINGTTQRLFCHGLWNDRSKIGSYDGAMSNFGRAMCTGGGPYYWHTRWYEKIKGFGPTQTTPNSTYFLIPNPNNQESIGGCRNYFNHTFQSWSAITTSLEFGSNDQSPSEPGAYKVLHDDSAVTDLTCLVLNLGYIGSDIAYLIKVNVQLNVLVLGSNFVTPADANFDYRLYGIFNTKGSNNIAWNIGNAGTSFDDNIVGKKYLMGNNVPYVVTEAGLFMTFYGDYSLMPMADGSIGSIRLPLPALRMGNYSAVGAGSENTYIVTGYAMVVEASLFRFK